MVRSPSAAAAEADMARELNRSVVLRETRARLLRAVKQTYGGRTDLQGTPSHAAGCFYLPIAVLL